MRLRGRPAVLAGLAAVASLASCAPAEPPPTDQPASVTQAVGAVQSGEGFTVRVSLPRAGYAATDPIPVETTVLWTGDAPIGTIWGPADGPVSFTFTELTGQREMGGAYLDGCFPKQFPRSQAIRIPYRKGAGRVDFGPPGFYDAWFADPALHLPAGRWRLHVLVTGSLAPGCDRGGRSLMIELDPIDLMIR